MLGPALVVLFALCAAIFAAVGIVVRQRATLTSAALVTAGGLLFVGDADRWFRAYDAATGKALWHTRVSTTNAPETYMLDGHQYVLVAGGDTVYAFRLQ